MLSKGGVSPLNEFRYALSIILIVQSLNRQANTNKIENYQDRNEI